MRRMTCVILATMAVSCGSEDATEAVLYPQDGTWTEPYPDGIGALIQFYVEDGGTRLFLESAEYGPNEECGVLESGGVCEGDCWTDITNSPGEATFNHAALGCTGTFTSTTAAAGTCSNTPDGCDHAGSRSWKANLKPDPSGQRQQ